MANTTYEPRDAATVEARVEITIAEIAPAVNAILAIVLQMVSEGHSPATASSTALFAAGFACRRLGVVLTIDPSADASDPLVDGYRRGAPPLN